MTRRNHEERLRDGRYRRWVELDQVQAKVWRYAWDLLLEDRPERTLEDICIALHERGYKLRSGASFVNFMPNGKIRYHKSALTRSFHNPFYAGLVYLHEIF